MQIIIISPNNKTHKYLYLGFTQLIILSGSAVVLLGMYVLLVMYCWESSFNTPIYSCYSQSRTMLQEFNRHTLSQRNSIIVDDFYVKQLGNLQSEAIRLKSLTEKLVSMSGIDIPEILLSNTPIQDSMNKKQYLPIDKFNSKTQRLSLVFKLHHQQLIFLQELLIIQDNIKSAIPKGRPIEGGWVSSYYGNRIDPFTGKRAFHDGLDLAGKIGSSIHAVAHGIVTWTSRQGGYGGLVEVEHGNGYITRYAHNKIIIVKVGDKVCKGQVLALMGSTGRSTGPHVHFEIIQDGKNVNPYIFVKR